jgi:hypothetical protein
MNNATKQFIAAGFGGLVTTGNAAITVLMETSFEAVTQGQWIVMSLLGGVAAFGAWKTLLARSPKQ